MIFIFYLFILLLTFDVFVIGETPYACDTAYCVMLAKCPKFHCKGKDVMTLSNATACGCCNVCVKELEKDSFCTKELRYYTPETQCGPHLMCVEEDKKGARCKKISEITDETKVPKWRTTCEREARDLSRTHNALGKYTPECDEYGFFRPTQCKDGTLCYCVDKYLGKTIFGSNTYNQKDDMNCLCSRQYSEVNEKLRQLGQQNPIDSINFIRCKANGNYEDFQMNYEYAYCINTTSGEMLAKPVVKSNQKKLPCFDKKSEYTQETKCFKEYNEKLEKMNLLQKDYDLVVGYDLPNCDIDGSYKPVQCLNSQCYCVNKKGEKYSETDVLRNSVEAFAQNCNCVRELELISELPKSKWNKVTELFSQYICDKNGNYYPVQCSESTCYCVETDTGFQSSSPILKSSVDQMKPLLPCWKDYQDHLDRTFNDFYQDQY